MKQLFFLALITTFLLSCNTTKKAQTDTQVLSLKHGVSFGHCVGYCTRELVYTPGKVVYTQSSRNGDSYPTKETVRDYSKADFDALIKAIDWNKWETMPETIGCPDCADGGAEYIEIVTEKGTKRVVFEAHSQPEGLEKALEILFKTKQSFEPEE